MAKKPTCKCLSSKLDRITNITDLKLFDSLVVGDVRRNRLHVWEENERIEITQPHNFCIECGSRIDTVEDPPVPIDDAEKWAIIHWAGNSFAYAYRIGYILDHWQDFVDAYRKEGRIRHEGS